MSYGSDKKVENALPNYDISSSQYLLTNIIARR